MPKFQGRDGELRIYSNTGYNDFPAINIISSQANVGVDGWFYDGTSAWTELGSSYDPTNSEMLKDTDDEWYIGADRPFAGVYFDFATVYLNVTTGISVEYFNGSAWTAVANLNLEDILNGTHYLGQNGWVWFSIPADWDTNGLAANGDDTMYYVRIKLLDAPTNGGTVDANKIAAGTFYYFRVPFVQMNLSAPFGTPQTEEQLVLDRETANDRAHYVEGSDERVLDPIEFSFEALIDDTLNKINLAEALQNANAAQGAFNWASRFWGGNQSNQSSKLSTRDGKGVLPNFYGAGSASTRRGVVGVQCVWGTYPTTKGVALYDCRFDEEAQALAEANDRLTLQVKGLCYGMIEPIYGFGQRIPQIT